MNYRDTIDRAVIRLLRQEETMTIDKFDRSQEEWRAALLRLLNARIVEVADETIQTVTYQLRRRV